MAVGMIAEPVAGALRVTPPEPTRVSEVLGSRGIWMTELRAEVTSLEDEFLRLTGDVDDPDPVPETLHEPVADTSLAVDVRRP